MTAAAVPALAVGAGAKASEATLQTWHPWQLDSVLVAWALGQGAAAPPTFESLPRGEPIPPDRAIDTPDSPYRRTGQRTAFEEAVRRRGLQHPCIERLRAAVRVVELAPWRKPEFPLVEAFEAEVLQAVPTRPRVGGLEPAFGVVGRYCAGGAAAVAPSRQ